ncbi:MAG: HAD-IIA family hydrolase [Caldilineales bacterium]|nr:HAD-IIA family hydrolase [Caldilineales bacterium]
MPLKTPYSQLKVWLIDMDGVVYRGSEPLPGAAAFIAALQETKTPFLFLTNNATKTPDQSLDRLARMDINVSEREIFTSALATAAYLCRHYPPPQNVVVVGGQGIRVALTDAGYNLASSADEADLVVSALDQSVTYAHLAEATLAINRGCPWIATNADPSLPSERGDLPGAGAIIALLAAATGRDPLVIGKPETGIFTQALAQLRAAPGEAVMLGDRLTTDILGGHNAGLMTMCVLTGIATQTDAENYRPRPDFIIPDLTSLLD